jgi:molecular chaperone DnaJ
MATTRDYYEVLGIQRDADAATVKRAYRKMAMKHHPDRNPDDKDAERSFKEAAEAYEVLSDDQKRARYDRFGHAGMRGQAGHDFSHMDPSDIFSMFDDIFGGGGGRARGTGGPGAAAGRRGYDLETQVDIALEDVAIGVERDLEFTRQDTCETCKGTGGKPGSEPVTCLTCGGAGQVQQAGFGGMFRMVSACPSCKGQGKVYPEKCEDCRGVGRKPVKRKLSVRVPKGIHDGQAIRVPGEGEPGEGGGIRGDLHVVVRVDEHPLFERHENDLILKVPVSFTQLALGTQMEVATLDGPADVTVKPGTQHGHTQRLAGKGLPDLRGRGSGDLILVLQMEVPRELTDKQEQLLREFADTEDHDVMPRSRSFWHKIKEHLS